MKLRVCLLVVSMAWCGLPAAPLLAAEWDAELAVITPPESNATLAVTNRSAVVDDGGTVHLVYQENVAGGRYEVLYVTRDPGGAWGAPIHLTPPEMSARNASIARDSLGRLHVLWEDVTSGEEDVAHIMRDTDGGWSAAVKLFPAAGFSRLPVGAVDSFGRLHAVWMDTRNFLPRVLHATWTPESGWVGPDVLSPGAISPQDVTLDTDRLGGIHVVWSDRVPSDPRDPIWSIFYVRLDAASSVLPAPTQLVPGQGIAVRPYVEAKDDGTVHLVWLDDRAATRLQAFEIFYKRYLPGIGWGKDKRFTYDITNHGRPLIVAGAGESLNILWEDYRSSAPDIYYRQITPETGWDREETPLTTDTTSSQNPTLVSLPDGTLLALWSDSQETGNFRVLARKGRAVVEP